MMLTEVLEPRTAIPAGPERQETTLVCLLGSFRLLHANRPLDFLVAGKAMALLSALALHLEAGVPRETLLELLWPEQDLTQSTVSLNSLVYSLHRRLRLDERSVSAVIHANGSYYLNREAGFSTDIALFDFLVSRGNWLSTTGATTDAAGFYRRALDVYRGDLCTGTDVFAVIERERLRASFLSVLARLAEHAFREEDFTAALDLARRLLACDPCREDAHRVVMRAHVRRGERAQALRQYRLCEHALLREFEIEPETSTTELFERIRLDPASV